MASLNTATAPAAVSDTPTDIPAIHGFTSKTVDEIMLMTPSERRAYMDEVKNAQSSVRKAFGFVDQNKKDKDAEFRANLLAEILDIPNVKTVVMLGDRPFEMPISQALAPDADALHVDIPVMKGGKEEIRNMTVVMQSYRVNALRSVVDRLKKSFANEMIRSARKPKADTPVVAPVPASVPAPKAKGKRGPKAKVVAAA